jgi:hypothetical protein
MFSLAVDFVVFLALAKGKTYAKRFLPWHANY